MKSIGKYLNNDFKSAWWRAEPSRCM